MGNMQKRKASTVQKANKAEKVVNWLDQNESKIQKLVGDDVPKERLRRLSLTMIREQDKIAECTPESVINCVMKAVQYDLDLEAGEAYLVPYGNQAEFQIGYKGLIRLAERSEEVKKVHADVVRESGEFQFYKDNTGLHFRHDPVPFSDEPIIGAYAVAYNYGSDILDMELVSKKELRQAADQSGNPRNDNWSDAWKDWTAQMCKKVPIKRMLNKFDKSSATTSAIADDNEKKVVDIGDAENVPSSEQAQKFAEKYSMPDQETLSRESDTRSDQPSEPDKESAKFTPESAETFIKDRLSEDVDLHGEDQKVVLDWLAHHAVGDPRWKRLEPQVKIDLAEKLHGSSTKRVLQKRLQSVLKSFWSDALGKDDYSHVDKSTSNLIHMAKRYHDILTEDTE